MKPTIDCYQSESDGVWVVHIDTEGCPEDSNGPIMRVYINDDTDNPVYCNLGTRIFQANKTDLKWRNGQNVKILGTVKNPPCKMYRVKFPDGMEHNVFADEVGL